jgi:hypothetical protein
MEVIGEQTEEIGKAGITGGGDDARFRVEIWPNEWLVWTEGKEQ